MHCQNLQILRYCRYLLKSLVALTLGVSLELQAANSCVVLQYHHFSNATPAITSVTPKQFEQHLQYLEQQQFQVLTLREVVTALKQQQALPDKCVSLSVDDAYISVFDTAYPLLKARGWPMTVFVNSQSVDQGLSQFMNWQQMREMAQHGFSFENHGHAHLHMIRAAGDESESDWLQRMRSDIETAQQRITAELKIAPVLFAYPFGEYNPKLMNLVESLGLTGFGQQSGPAWSEANMAALPRFPMNQLYAKLEGFKTKVNTLPLPILKASPLDPLTDLTNRRPTLTLQFKDVPNLTNRLNCFVSGRQEISLKWLETPNNTVEITPKFDLTAGRHRTNCTMASEQPGRFHWYSHNWFVRKADGRWYAEY